MSELSQATDAWHIELDGSRHGPVTEAEIQKLVAEQRVRRDTLCWQPGFEDWKAAAATALSKYFINEPPPLSAAAVPNGLVWTLAFAPIIGVFLSGFLTGLTETAEQRGLALLTGRHVDRFWWITIVLNVALSLLDERKLKKAGYYTKKMGSAWIVPVYLYKRATTLKQNLAYFFVWIVCFGLSLFM
jgi:hypothetical protein